MLDQVSHKLVYLGLVNGVAMSTGTVTFAPILSDSSVFCTILQTPAALTRSNPGCAASSAGLTQTGQLPSSCPGHYCTGRSGDPASAAMNVATFLATHAFGLYSAQRHRLGTARAAKSSPPSLEGLDSAAGPPLRDRLGYFRIVLRTWPPLQP